MNRGSWFGRRNRAAGEVPEGFATNCAKCREILFVRDLERNLQVCMRCGHHHRLNARERLAITVDDGSFVEMDSSLRPRDPLQFPEYAEKIRRARASTGLEEAILTGSAAIEGQNVIIGVADFGFMGGSMGSVVGEKIARALERAASEKVPAILFSASGGARMHEGLLSLVQMAKTSAAVARLNAVRVPYISVLTDPTTGGVYASYASLGDIILAEPGATVGFAGRRVGNQDLSGDLPRNFQTSEFQHEHGMIDRIVPRREMRQALSSLLALLGDREAVVGS